MFRHADVVCLCLVAMLLLYSTSLNGKTIDYSAVGDSTICFGLLDIVPLLLLSNW